MDRGETHDQRWVYCRRPLLTVGGELTLDQLELSFSPTAKFYKAPVQLVANGGVLVIDDFGRQKCSPVDLLNRWITPLESRIDYLPLETGQKLPVPFVLLIVFATNLRPTDLVDEAFLRRIHYKVFAENPTRQDFKNIFERCCIERHVPYDEAIVDNLLTTYFDPRGILPRGCHPRDLIDQAISLADYRGEPHRLTERPALGSVRQLLRRRSHRAAAAIGLVQDPIVKVGGRRQRAVHGHRPSGSGVHDHRLRAGRPKPDPHHSREHDAQTGMTWVRNLVR